MQNKRTPADIDAKRPMNTLRIPIALIYAWLVSVSDISIFHAITHINTRTRA